MEEYTYKKIAKRWVVSFLIAALSITESLHAATRTWNGGGGNNNWSTTANWNELVAPVTGDDLHFAGSTRLGPVMQSSYTIGSITFDSGAGAFTLNGTGGTGPSLTIGSGGITNASSNIQSVNIYSISLSASQTWSTTSSGNLTFGNGGGIGLGGTGRVLTLSPGSGTSITINSVISGTGGAGLVQSGTGTTILTGANTYNGTTTINSGGTLQVGNNTSAGSLGTGTVTNNGNLRFLRTGVYTVSNAISGSGNITNLAAGTLTLSGVISGSNNLAQSGTGTTILTGANTYTGTTTINNGTLQVGNSTSTGSLGTGTVTNNGSLVFKRSTSISVSNVISGSGSLTQSGAGPLTLTGNNTYTGPTTIDAGKALILLGISTNNIAFSSNIKVLGNLSVTGLSGGTIVIGPTQTLSGTGVVVGKLIIGSGGIISPGSSPGTLTTGSETWAAGGVYNWEVNKVDPTIVSQATLKGLDPGFDTLAINGALTITADSSNPFTINVIGLDLLNVPGAVNQWDPSKAYQWILATATSIVGFNPASFIIGTSGFNLNNPVTGNFTLTADATHIYLNYANAVAAPEPSTWIILGVALGFIFLFSERLGYRRA